MSNNDFITREDFDAKYEQWHKDLWRSFRMIFIPYTIAMIAAGIFTIWLIRG